MTWANQIRILKQEFIQFGSIVGKGVIAAFKPFIKGLNNVMLKVIGFTENVLNALGQIFGWKYEISAGSLDDDLGDSADAMGNLSDGAGNTASGIKDATDAAKKFKSVVLGIDELNLNEPDTDSGSGSGGSGGSGGGSGNGSGSGSGGNTGLSIAKQELKSYESDIKTLYQLGNYISNALSDTLEGIDWNAIYKKAENFGSGLADFLNGLITPRLFYDLGKTIASSINTALHAVNAFAVSYNWDGLGKSLASGIKGFFENWDAGLTGETFSNLLSGVLKAITSGVNELTDNQTWVIVGQKLVDFICGINWKELTWNIGGLFEALVEAVIKWPEQIGEGIGQEIIDKILSDKNIDSEKVIKKLQPIAQGFHTFFETLYPTLGVVRLVETISETFKTGGRNIIKYLSDCFETIKLIFSPLTSWFSEKFTAAYEGVKNAWAFIGTWASEKWEQIKAPFKNIKKYFSDGFTGAYNAVKKIWNGIGKYFKGIANDIITPIGKAVNGVISGVNWVLSKVGSKTRLDKWTVPKFAKGTDGLPQDTVGMVNDQPGNTYREMIVPKNGEPFIPKGRNVVLPMEKGTKIMPAGQTADVMNGLPRFAGGIGKFFSNAWESAKSFTGDVLDYLENPGKIVKIAIDKFVDTTGWDGVYGTIASSAVNKVLDSVIAFVKKIFDSSGAGAEKAVKWAIGIANDNSHGYDQANRWGNPDYDCSSLIISAFEHAGIKLKSAGATYTGNMYSAAKKLGFADVTGSVNKSTGSGIKRGDILLNRKNHTAMSIGNGQLVQASSNEKGGITGGIPGDQTGREIWTRGYYNFPWDDVLRYAKFKKGFGKISLADLIPAYEVGGFPEDGLFSANHNELIGQFSNGKNAVTNNYQIESGIEKAVYKGYMKAHAEDTREVSILEQILSAIKEGKTISIDGREIVKVYDSRKSRNGYAFT